MLGALREALEPMKQAMARPLASLGVPPLAVTLGGLLLAVAAAHEIRRGDCPWAPWLALLAGSADLLDGAVARLQGRATPFGNYAEALVDRLVEIALLLGLSPLYPDLVPYALAGCLFISYCNPRVALVVATDNRDWRGVGDHVDRMVLLMVIYLVHSWHLQALARAGLLVLLLVTVVGSGQRLMYARKLIQEAGKGPEHS